MARLQDNRSTVYAAADLWKRNCLLADESVFGAGGLWTADHASTLLRHFADNPDTGDRSFEEKLRDQLEPTTAAVKELAAEMLWVMMLFPDNIKGKSKVRLVRTVWEWSGVPFPEADKMVEVMETGIGSGGIGYNNFRPLEFLLLIRFTVAWKAIDPKERERLLSDPWGFADWLDRQPGATSRQLRHMLLHLLFPEQFERISSRNDKKKVDSAFTSILKNVDLDLKDRAPTALARDRRLWHIRQLLEAGRPGAWLDFYLTPDLYERWGDRVADPKAGEPKKDAEPAVTPLAPGNRSWAIGAGAGAARWPVFLEQELIAIGWDELGDLREYSTHDDIRAAIKRVYERDQNPINDSLACYQFCREMAVGDDVYVKQGLNRILGHGRIIGDYEYDGSRPDFRNVRRVEWLRRGNWTLPEAAQLPSKTLTEVTHYPPFREVMREHDGEGTPGIPAPKPYGVDDIMKEAFLSRQGVEQILASLRRRKNLILQGSPGVGKSFLARRLAYGLIGAEAPDNVQMVQFHQSYAYEDFIQGWRPSSTGGFVLRNGVFHEFCQRAQARPGQPHVFVIDEINRGNLSKVFGELLLLIETDKRGPDFAIPLTYAESGVDTFYVPDNVYIIGLMNTADRSLAMVDYALRRRFAFTTLEPAFESPQFQKTLLDRGVEVATVERIVARVGEVNKRISSDSKNLGAGFAVGHSYFCPTATVVDSVAWYDAVVNEEIAPLLREYWFDDETRIAECLKILAD